MRIALTILLASTIWCGAMLAQFMRAKSFTAQVPPLP